MLKYLVILLVLITAILYIYSVESPIQRFILIHAPSYYVSKVYYMVVNEIVNEVVNERIISRVITEPYIDLSYGSTPIPTIVIKTVNSPPPYYIRLIAYDNYMGSSWLLSKGREYILRVNYQVLGEINLSNGKTHCYLIREEILNSSIDLKITSEMLIACYGGDYAYVRVKVDNTTLFSLSNEFIIPLPADFLVTTAFSTEFDVSYVIPLILMNVIPIPTQNSSNITLTLYIDNSLRYIRTDNLLNQGVDSLLIFDSDHRELKRAKINVLNKYHLSYSTICSGDTMVKDDVCYKSLIKLTRNVLCDVKHENYSLGFIVRRLTDKIRELATYGSTDLSSYVNSTCRDLTSIFLLKAHRGVCIHYASALSVMLKALGFNARLATGLVRVAYTNVNNSELYVGFYVPHAWSEVLVPEGYVAFDPTPPQRSGSTPSYSTALNMFRAYMYRERAEKPYPGVKVLMRRAVEEELVSTHIPSNLLRLYSKVSNFITTNISYILTALIIIILVLNNEIILRGLTKLLKVLSIRGLDIKSLAKVILEEVYDDLGLRMPKHLTLRELLRNLRSTLDQELLTLLELFVRKYEELRYGGRGSVNELRMYAKLILRRLRVHATT